MAEEKETKRAKKAPSRLKERRKELGMSAADVADALKVSRTTLYRYETGFIGKIPAEVIFPWAALLETTPEDLLDIPTDFPAAKFADLDEADKERIKGEIDAAYLKVREVREAERRRRREAESVPGLTRLEVKRVEADIEKLRVASAAFMDDVKDKEAFMEAIKNVMFDAKREAKKKYTPKRFRKETDDEENN